MEKKYIERYNSYKRSLAGLEEARYRDPSDSFVLSGTIAKYNLTFDLAWKVMKDVLLEDYGISDFASGSPRETLRTAASNGMIADDRWLAMLRLRNNLTHDYDGRIAANSFRVILEEYLPLMNQFQEYMEDHLRKEAEIETTS